MIGSHHLGVNRPDVNTSYNLGRGRKDAYVRKNCDDRVDDRKPLFFLYKMYIYNQSSTHIHTPIYFI